jgi:hypothetical protein
MQGVRRWMGAQSTSPSHKRLDNAVTRTESNRSRPEAITESRSTADLATSFLDPRVSEEEEAEYEKYVVLIHWSIF